jgi:hypothetical protein
MWARVAGGRAEGESVAIIIVVVAVMAAASWDELTGEE